MYKCSYGADQEFFSLWSLLYALHIINLIINSVLSTWCESERQKKFCIFFPAFNMWPCSLAHSTSRYMNFSGTWNCALSSCISVRGVITSVEDGNCSRKMRRDSVMQTARTESSFTTQQTMPLLTIVAICKTSHLICDYHLPLPTYLLSQGHMCKICKSHVMVTTKCPINIPSLTNAELFAHMLVYKGATLCAKHLLTLLCPKSTWFIYPSVCFLLTQTAEPTLKWTCKKDLSDGKID